MNHGPLSIPNVDLADVLGAGAFGTVHKGRHRSLGIDVAVKLIDTSRIDQTGPGTLLQEAQLMARLDHPNLLRVFDAGRLDRYVYVVCEFMDGGSCADLRNVSPAVAGKLSRQLLSGLQALHEARILHRDIKPANCLKRSDHRVKLGDLGLAMQWSSTTQQIFETAGTIPFMAPELFENPPRYAPQSDLYALGMTLACYVLEDVPFPRGALSAVLPWIVQGTRPRITERRPDLPSTLGVLVERMMSPRADLRPATVADALRELGEQSESVPDESPTLIGGPTIGPWIIGDQVYSSSNWEGWTVTHRRSGKPARLMRLQPESPLRDVSQLVLDAAERASRITDPFIVPVYDWGLSDERVFVVTAPWGHTLLDLVRTKGPLDEPTALRFARDLASGLTVIHQRGFVYQNLDPGSAVVSYNARSAQLSWPIYCVPAGHVSDRRIVVPRYAAPEALTAATPTIDAAVDVFGLGAALLFLITGAAPPRQNESVVALIRRASPEVTAATASFVRDLLDPLPEQRPTSLLARDRIGELLSHVEGHDDEVKG